MGKPLGKKLAPPHSRWRWAAGGIVVLIVVGAAAFWWGSGGRQASGGGPRLAVDRAAIDLGDLAFDAPARAVFVLTNVGDAPVEIAEVPPVRALQGC